MLGQYGCVLHVNLRLAPSSNNRALTIRDHLLPLVRERGTLENQRGPVRLIVLEMGLRKMQHWTPFNELSAGEASSPAIATRSSGSTRGRIYSTGSTWGEGCSAFCGRTMEVRGGHFPPRPWEDEAL